MDQGILRADADGRIPCQDRRRIGLPDLPADFLASQPTLPQVAAYQLDHGHFGEGSAFAQPATTCGAGSTASAATCPIPACAAGTAARGWRGAHADRPMAGRCVPSPK